MPPAALLIRLSTWARSPASSNSEKFRPANVPVEPKKRESAALASVMLPFASAKAMPMGASRNRSPIFSLTGAADELDGSGAVTTDAGAAAAARLRTGCGEGLGAPRGAAARAGWGGGAGGGRGRKPPGGLPIRQRTDRRHDLQPRHDHKAF